ncbi:MAG TPA: MlaD family protein [Aeromicrobium sp.]|nr:MlaD family protein [Aeromicrobium sp.]HKY58125.1 MlaD family protein [Aeromicrobium sp.]
MERKHVVSSVGIASVFALCVLYLFAVALKTPLTEKPVEVAVSLPASGGLYQGSEVTYRGIRVGRVTQLDLSDSGVRATVRLDSTARVPRDARPKVRSLSPVGEQYIDFQPGGASGPFLADGDAVRGSAEDLPTALATTAINLDKLIKQIDPATVRLVLTETAKGLEGSEEDLQRLLVQSVELLEDFNERWPQTERLIDNGDELLRLGEDLIPEMNDITDDAETFANWLRKIDPVLVDMLEDGPGQIEELRALVRDTDEVLGSYLDPYITLADFMAAREPHLRALLQNYPRGFRALSSAIRGGAAHLDAFFEYFDHCGYNQVEHDALDTTRYPFQDDGHCSRDWPASQRGAQWAPGPLR